jgi:hypothetical protein
MGVKSADVPLESGTAEKIEIIDSQELARRWKVPESWVRSHCQPRMPQADRIPCLRLGRYVRFRWGSPELEHWLLSRQENVPRSMTMLPRIKTSSGIPEAHTRLESRM